MSSRRSVSTIMGATTTLSTPNRLPNCLILDICDSLCRFKRTLMVTKGKGLCIASLYLSTILRLLMTLSRLPPTL